ncbi:uncharacterized protein RJT21DRAFT_122085 [Scheffersomyces amazonensis]|uniref:uncharacterized protein n=1 Tax=Scheffersomyces amazonensis TaxID=1078765 RepID=UPI00315CA3D7
MSWDDEDFDVPTTSSNTKATLGSWEDEEEDAAVLESWDIDEEEEERKKKEAEAQKAKERAELKRKQDEAKAKKAASKSGEQVLLEIDTLDEHTRREVLKEAEKHSDLKNTQDLFGELSVDDGLDFNKLNEHPREAITKAAIAAAQAKRPVITKDTPLEVHPLFQPATKAEFEKLRKTLGTTLTKLADDSLLNYSSSLAIDLIRDLAQPLSLENVRKLVSTLNVLVKDKEREERQARLKKTGGTASGGAGKKKAKPAARPNVGGFKKDGIEDDFDDFGDDDFM